MEHVGDASADGDAPLAKGGEEFGKGGTVEFHDALACDAAPGCAHANGAEFVRVGVVLVEGHEPIGGVALVERGGDSAIEHQGEHRREGLEIREVVREVMVRLMQGHFFEDFRKVSVGAGSGAFRKAGEGVMKDVKVHGDGGRGCGSSSVVKGGLVGGGGDIKFSADDLVVGVHGGYGHG